MTHSSYKSAVVLGAAGFIGSHLTAELVKQNYKVTCFDRHESPAWPDSVLKITGDFQDPPQILLDQMDNALVFHLISVTRPSINTSQIADAINQDLTATIRCLESTQGRNIRWVFVSSGGTVYGDKGPEPIPETEPLAPICSYGLIKMTLENYFALYRRLHNIDYVVVRPSNPYGPGQDPLRGQGIIPHLIYKGLTQTPVEIWGDGTVVRDYIYISDAAAGILAAANQGQCGEAYNIGTGRGCSVNELIELILSRLKQPIDVHYTESRPVDVSHNVLSHKKITEQTGWAPSIDIQAGIDATTRWIEEFLTAIDSAGD